jgi:hypothetical protein
VGDVMIFTRESQRLARLFWVKVKMPKEVVVRIIKRKTNSKVVCPVIDFFVGGIVV